MDNHLHKRGLQQTILSVLLLGLTHNGLESYLSSKFAQDPLLNMQDKVRSRYNFAESNIYTICLYAFKQKSARNAYIGELRASCKSN